MAKRSAALIDERSATIAEGGSDPITRTWDKSHGLYIAGRAYLDEADLTGSEMEAKWGVGRLRLLVGPELREKFDRQRYLFNQAVWHGDLEAVRRESQRMVKAWLALDKAAIQAGKSEKEPWVLETVLADGTVAAIITSNEDTRHIKTEGRKVAVYTLAEIAKLLDGYPMLAKVKQHFPGATVTQVRRPDDPLDALDSSKPGLDEMWSKGGDVIPF